MGDIFDSCLGPAMLLATPVLVVAFLDHRIHDLPDLLRAEEADALREEAWRPLRWPRFTIGRALITIALLSFPQAMVGVLLRGPLPTNGPSPGSSARPTNRTISEE
jgi:hypothetical protein